MTSILSSPLEGAERNAFFFGGQTSELVVEPKVAARERCFACFLKLHNANRIFCYLVANGSTPLDLQLLEIIFERLDARAGVGT